MIMRRPRGATRWRRLTACWEISMKRCPMRSIQGRRSRRGLLLWDVTSSYVTHSALGAAQRSLATSLWSVGTASCSWTRARSMMCAFPKNSGGGWRPQLLLRRIMLRRSPQNEKRARQRWWKKHPSQRQRQRRPRSLSTTSATSWHAFVPLTPRQEGRQEDRRRRHKPKTTSTSMR